MKTMTENIDDGYASDSNVVSVLNDDGIQDVSWESVTKYQNITSISLDALREDFGGGSWAVRLAYNDRFGGVVIQQHPGEGNRKHMHSDAAENWVILDGEWEWWIEGETRKVQKGDFIYVPPNTWHKITCIGTGPGVRYAITKPDVDHIYEK